MNLRQFFPTTLGLMVFFLALQPSFAAPDGNELYQEHCAVCHGTKGQGGVGVPLSLPSFLEIVPKSYLQKTMRLGRPGRVMPAFKQLSDAEVSAIADFIISWQKSPRTPVSDEPVKGDANNGARLFRENCIKCHGANGEGGKGTGVTFSRPRDLPIIPPALNNKGFLSAASDQFIKTTLIKDRTNTPMMSFTEKDLSETQINDIVAHVRSFETSANDSASASIAGLPPVLTYTSSYSLADTVENVKQAIIGANFLLIREQHFDYGLVAEDKEDPNQVIIYFCNFNLINDLLKIDPRIGIFLPCRITITERDGKVQLTTINPKILNEKFNNNELNEACDHMYDMYRHIMEESI